MDAAVPFALVAAVQLLALAAALGLAAAGGAVAFRRGSRVLLVTGGVLLAASHGLTGAILGAEGGDRYAVVRAVAYVLIGAAAGGLSLAPSSAGVVVPIGAAAGPAGLAAAAAVLAAGLSRRARRPGSVLLTAALALSAATELLAPAARTSTAAAVTLLGLRGAASLAVLAFVVRLVQNSLLAKVVAAILAAVLGLALGTALIVGSVATGSLDRDSERRLAEVAASQVEILLEEKQTSLSLAQVFAGCRSKTSVCEAQLRATATRATITGVICAPRQKCGIAGGASFRGLDDPVGVTSLRRSAAVREVLARRDHQPVASLQLVLGRTPMLVAAGVAPIVGDTPVGTPPAGATVYAVAIDAERVREIGESTGFDATLYLADSAVATTLGEDDRRVLDEELRRLDVLARLGAGDGGISVGADGSRPGVRFQPVRSEDETLVGVLALSAESNVILATQRRVLSSLFLGTIAIALLVGVLAVLLGRRIVRPVTELTVAASRVRRGDLDVRTELHSADELGVLSRTFDAMTTSLAASNESLRKAAADEAALRGRLETVLDSIGDGLVTTDARDHVSGVNRAARELLGCEEENVVGRPVTAVLTGSMPSGEPLLNGFDAARDARVGRVERGDGASIPVALAATPLRGEEGHVVVIRDMTREHEVERMKTEFLSNVSHELRTPLTPIRGYAEILHRRPDLPPDKTVVYAGSILDSSIRMTRVVDLLVDVASLEAGRVVPQVGPVGVGEFVDKRVEAWRRREPGREFRRRVAAKLPDVLIDMAWVTKAFDELVDNAVKYSSKPVTLSASLSDDGRHVRLTVRDVGPGIPEDRRASLFTPFEQVDGSATRAVGGLGLGLSFVRRVADDFGLDVVVESTVGKGSAFSLEVPVAPPALPTPRAPRSTSRPKGRTR